MQYSLRCEHPRSRFQKVKKEGSGFSAGRRVDHVAKLGRKLEKITVGDSMSRRGSEGMCNLVFGSFNAVLFQDFVM